MKKILIGLILVLCAGCASVKETRPDGSSFSYFRFGLQKIDGFSMTKNEQGVVKVSFTKQEGGESIVEALNKVSEVALTALKKTP